MPRPSRVEVFGFVGVGESRIKARASAETQIRNLSEGTWKPAIFEWMGEAVLVYRTAYGWEFTFIRHNGGPLRMSNGFTMPRSGRFEETQRYAIYALVQAAWRVGMDMDIFPDFLTDEEDRRELLRLRQHLLNIEKMMRSDGCTLDEALSRVFRAPAADSDPCGIEFGRRLEQKMAARAMVFLGSGSVDEYVADKIKEKGKERGKEQETKV